MKTATFDIGYAFIKRLENDFNFCNHQVMAWSDRQRQINPKDYKSRNTLNPFIIKMLLLLF
jgi:hypothetical protein